MELTAKIANKRCDLRYMAESLEFYTSNRFRLKHSLPMFLMSLVFLEKLCRPILVDYSVRTLNESTEPR